MEQAVFQINRCNFPGNYMMQLSQVGSQDIKPETQNWSQLAIDEY